MSDKDLDGKSVPSIRNYLFSSVNQGSFNYWHIIKSLADGPKHWEELVKETKISRANLSQHLKKMKDRDIITKRRVKAFPPKAIYEFNEDHPQKQYIDWLKDAGKMLKFIDNKAWALVGLSKKSDRSTSEYAQILSLDNLGTNLEAIIYKVLHSLVKTPFNRHYEENIPLLTSLATIQIMHTFWTIYEVATAREKFRVVYEKELSVKVEEKEYASRNEVNLKITK